MSGRLRILEFVLEFIVVYAIYFVLMVSTKVLDWEELLILGVGTLVTLALRALIKGFLEHKRWRKRKGRSKDVH